jgi:hypothetical protein
MSFSRAWKRCLRRPLPPRRERARSPTNLRGIRLYADRRNTRAHEVYTPGWEWTVVTTSYLNG